VLQSEHSGREDLREVEDGGREVEDVEKANVPSVSNLNADTTTSDGRLEAGGS
jgi:hypothetical protein